MIALLEWPEDLENTGLTRTSFPNLTAFHRKYGDFIRFFIFPSELFLITCLFGVFRVIIHKKLTTFVEKQT